MWKKPHAARENPWGQREFLSGWQPGLSEPLDWMALVASLCRVQWEQARAQEQMQRALRQARWGWVLATFACLLNAGGLVLLMVWHHSMDLEWVTR